MGPRTARRRRPKRSSIARPVRRRPPMRARLSWFAVFVLGWWVGRGDPWRFAAAAPPPPPSAPGLADVIARTDPSVVHVAVQMQGRAPTASRDDGIGSGFVLDADGLIVASRHV